MKFRSMISLMKSDENAMQLTRICNVFFRFKNEELCNKN